MKTQTEFDKKIKELFSRFEEGLVIPSLPDPLSAEFAMMHAARAFKDNGDGTFTIKRSHKYLNEDTN